MIIRKETLRAVVALVTTVAIQSTAIAGIPKNGLGAIAVSNDGSTIYAAGDNRVLYVLDAKDLSVKKRVWIELNPFELILTKDGKTLIMHDSSGLLTFLDAETFTTKKTIEKAILITVAWDAGLIITTGNSSGRGENSKTKIMAYSLDAGKLVMKADVKGNIGAVSALSDASKIFAITNGYKSKGEKKDKTPKDLRGIEKATFKQKHDGYVSQVVTLKSDGSETARFTTWFNPGRGALMHSTSQGIKIASPSNVNALLDHTGKTVSLFKTESFGHYGFSFTRDGKKLVSGGMKSGAVTKFDSGDSHKFKVKKIGGWPEYFRGFAIGPKGMIYGGTSAYRLVKVSPDGEILVQKPIF
ncbi:MAG: hypothetical protein V3V02_03345 [Rhizobiaceae bacterium]